MGNDQKIRQYNMFRGFKFKDACEKIKGVKYDDIVRFLYSPTDPSSLGVVRFLFGES